MHVVERRVTCPISYAITWISTRDFSLATRLHEQAVDHGSLSDDGATAQFCSFDDAKIQLWAALRAGKLQASASFVGSKRKALIADEVLGGPMAAHTWTCDLAFYQVNGLDSLIDYTTDPPREYIYVYLSRNRLHEVWPEIPNVCREPGYDKAGEVIADRETSSLTQDGIHSESHLSEKRRGGLNTQKDNISGKVKAWIEEEFSTRDFSSSADARTKFEAEMVCRFVDVDGLDGRKKATPSNKRESTKVKGDRPIMLFVRSLFAKMDNQLP